MSSLSAGPGPTNAPPALPEGGLRVVALGGIGEVGRNMTVFQFDGRLLIVDCGVLFPEEHQPGVDVILPDLERPIRRREGRAPVRTANETGVGRDHFHQPAEAELSLQQRPRDASAKLHPP